MMLKEQKIVLKKVGEVLTDDDIVKDIIEAIGDSKEESLKSYKVNKKRRIEAILQKAGVTLQEYEKALSFTKISHKVVHMKEIEI